MRAKPTCPHCGQRMPVRRYGVIMSPLKASILDLIRKGVSNEAIHQRTGLSRATIKAHVWQINEMLAGTRWGSTDQSAAPKRRKTTPSQGRQAHRSHPGQGVKLVRNPPL